ncbi:MAG: T9SS type A sorting domain-containing protein [Gemmatimonadetes bacterium]|jgi:hypothetical protein|nr:T9SS type A sorting domain-containing protein [Gemmatimonadota bacterium]
MVIGRFRRFMILYFVFSCSSPLAEAGEAQTLFTDVTEEVMLPQNVLSRSHAFGDYDNDGWPDLFSTNVGSYSDKGRMILLHNVGDGTFVDRVTEIQADTSPRRRGGGSTFIDYDNDGDLDLFVPVGQFWSEYPGLNVLLRNDRGVFRDVTLEVGLTDELPTDNAIWLDYDRDGYLDLYTGNLGCTEPQDPTLRNKLYRQNGDGTFTDVTREAGLDLQFGDCGGSNGGMAAGDYNDDGWPDLYAGNFLSPNRLFLNNGQGEFQDATTGDIGDPGMAFGVAVGDIDNDGDLEIFQAAGGGGGGADFRSILLLNLGEGQFLDAGEGVGLSRKMLEGQILGANLADIDNDGDLDLHTGNSYYPFFLFLNNGDGTFVDMTSQIDPFWGDSIGDYDLDGFLDFWGDGLWRNNGNDNHWLRVEVVGTESNRSGIGARLTATAGGLQQMREISGGMGYHQHEMMAHFGLGPHAQVDRLEIRWPSGQVDVLTDLPVDRKIRVIEGREAYYVVEPTLWEGSSDSLVVGSAVDFEAIVRPALFEADAQIVKATADLSPFGGAEGTPLEDAGDGTYRLFDRLLPIETGIHLLSVMIDQVTSLGGYWTKLSRQIAVFPSEDQVVFDETLATDWEIEGLDSIAEEEMVYQGHHAARFHTEKQMRGTWTLSFKSSTSVRLFGFEVLRFAFRPAEVEWPDRPSFKLRMNDGLLIDLLEKLDPDQREWQVLALPMEKLTGDEQVESIRFSGNFGGTFYLDDIRLVAAKPGDDTHTAVLEQHSHMLPPFFNLDQNYPNPFNSDTVIRFALPTSENVELAIFNLAGQRVAKLADGMREAGVYAIRWDGRDDNGRELASGVYLYRLRTGDGQQVETRKLALVR